MAILPVTNFVLVAIEKSLEDLFEHTGCKFLGETACLLDPIE